MGISPAREIRRIDGEAPSLVLFDSSNRVNVSFAHSDNWVVVGLSLDIAIGVDIQSHRVLARRAEISELLKFEPGAKTSDEEFFACWALREAVAKATSGSVLSPHPSEPELAATCLQGNKIMSVGSMTALVDEVAGAHLAVVINADAALKQCAWQ
jgi:phosphopantetheinyl transferase